MSPARVSDTSVTHRVCSTPNMRRVERLAIIGVSHASGGTTALEAWQARHPDHLSVKGLGFDEAVTLATCNRFEAVVALPHDVDCDEARRRLTPATTPPNSRKAYAYRGEAALEHLARVAASLDSLNPGEDQIMRQVRNAFAGAKQDGTTGTLTEFAFTSAIKAAKRVRREVPLAPVNVSLFTLAMPILKRHLEPGDTVAVVGAGEMGALTVRGLMQAGLGIELVVINRDAERGRAVAAVAGASWLPLSDFLAAPPKLKALVAATPRAGLIDPALLARLPGLELVVDLGMPRNVTPGAAAERGVVLVDIDTLRMAGQRRRETIGELLADAEHLVQAEVENALGVWTDRQLAPAIRRLRALYRDTIGDDLPDEQAERLAHRFAHVPVKGLRALARRYGVEAATTFLQETERS